MRDRDIGAAGLHDKQLIRPHSHMERRQATQPVDQQHLAGDRPIGIEQKRFRSHAGCNDVTGPDRTYCHRDPHAVRKAYGNARGIRASDPSRQQIHTWRGDKTRHEQVRGMVIQLLR